MAALKQHLLLMARYNIWATRRLYERVDAVPESDYRRDTGLFFKSVHGTLNHLLVAEHELWYPRLAQGLSPKRALNEELESDRNRLRERLIAGAQRWLPLIETLDDARLDARLDYTSTEGIARSLPFGPTLAHVFNHGTHHRGQITAAITMLGHACPELDLPWMLQTERATR